MDAPALALVMTEEKKPKLVLLPVLSAAVPISYKIISAQFGYIPRHILFHPDVLLAAVHGFDIESSDPSRGTSNLYIKLYILHTVHHNVYLSTGQ